MGHQQVGRQVERHLRYLGRDGQRRSPLDLEGIDDLLVPFHTVTVAESAVVEDSSRTSGTGIVGQSERSVNGVDDPEYLAVPGECLLHRLPGRFDVATLVPSVSFQPFQFCWAGDL